MLELIYDDLATRNKSRKLTLENFLLFFGLTGLWGAKLFRQFDEDGHKLITKEEFFYGICTVGKTSAHCEGSSLRKEQAPLQLPQGRPRQRHPLQRLHQNGTTHLTQLYNYSRDDLKEILIEDKFMLPQLNRTISKNITTETQGDPCLLLKSNKIMPQQETVIELNYEDPVEEEATSFGKNYA